MFLRRAAAFFLVLLPALSIAAGEEPPLPAPKDTLSAIRQRGTLRAGVSTFVPWVMRNKSGELYGFGVDIARGLADDLGVDLELVPVPWTRVIPALLEGRFDVIVSRFSVTPERALFVAYSKPYAFSTYALLANRALAAGLHTRDAFDRPTVTLGVRTGTSSAERARRLFPKAKLKTFDDEAGLFAAVVAGGIHAVLSITPRPEIEAQRHPDKVVLPLEEPLGQWGEAFGVRKGDPDFVNYLDAWITARTLDGWIEERHDRWFKSLKWAEDF